MSKDLENINVIAALSHCRPVTCAARVDIRPSATSCFLRFNSLILCSIVLLCGCPGAKPGADVKTVVKPFRGQEVDLVVPAALQLPALWEVALHEWMDETGATIRWSEYTSDGSDNTEAAKGSLEAKLADAPTSGGRMVLFPLRKLSQLDSHLAAVDSGLELKDLFKGLRERVITRNRSPVAIPVSAPVLLCYYRADLLKAAGLKPPETWLDYQTLLDSLDRWAPGLTAIEPLGPQHRATLFYARSVAFAKHPENYSCWFDLDTGKPTIDAAGFLEATEVASRAWKSMPATISELTPADCRELILQGRSALAIGVEPTVSLKSAQEKRPASFEIGVCRLPGSVRVYNPNSKRWDAIPPSAVHASGLCGFDGMALGVCRTDVESKNQAAWHLLAMLAGDQFETNWAALPKSLCRESQVGSSTGWHESGLTVEEAGKVADATALTLRDMQLVTELPIPESDEFRRVTSHVLGRLLSNELEPSAVVKELQVEFEKIVEKVGVDKFRAEYRRGLGLPAL